MASNACEWDQLYHSLHEWRAGGVQQTSNQQTANPRARVKGCSLTDSANWSLVSRGKCSGARMWGGIICLVKETPRTYVPINIWCTIALRHCPLPPRKNDIWIIPQLWDNGEGDSLRKQAGKGQAGWIPYIQVLRTDKQAYLRYPLPTGYHQITRHAGPILPPYSWASHFPFLALRFLAYKFRDWLA